MWKWRKHNGQSDAPGHGVALRRMALQVNPSELGLAPSAGKTVWGVVMDTVMTDGEWHCLVVLGDGTTSLYTSSAFGVIGAGTHPTVRRASDALLMSTESELALFTPASTTDLPGAGQVTIRALTFDGHKTVTALEGDLGHSRHPAASIFHAAHAVISEVRRATPE